MSARARERTHERMSARARERNLHLAAELGQRDALAGDEDALVVRRQAVRELGAHDERALLVGVPDLMVGACSSGEGGRKWPGVSTPSTPCSLHQRRGRTEMRSRGRAAPACAERSLVWSAPPAGASS
jgi:hypothetical protein